MQACNSFNKHKAEFEIKLKFCKPHFFSLIFYKFPFNIILSLLKGAHYKLMVNIRLMFLGFADSSFRCHQFIIYPVT